MKRTRTSGLQVLFTFLGVVLGIVLLRFLYLDARTIHIDEGMGLRYGQLLLNSEWHYNPYNSHGPLYFFFTSFFFGIFGSNIAIARAGMALVNLTWLSVLLWLYWPLLRTPGRLVLLASLGFSSGMVFFARNFIHEHIFILMTVCTLLAGEMWVRHRDYRAPAAFIIFSGLMYATKETALLTWAAWVGSALVLLFSPRHQPHLHQMHWKSVGIGVATAVVLHAVLFTVFFHNPSAFYESLIGPLRWAQRAREMHIRPFYYFLQLLIANEFPLVLGGLWLTWRLTLKKQWNPRLVFFALWTLFITLAYSMIKYKTPWCTPNLILPLGLFSAFAFDTLWKKLKKQQKRVWAAVAVVLLALGSADAWADSVLHPDRVRIYDYAYLQSDSGLRKFLQTIEDINTLYGGEEPIPMQRIGQTDELIYLLTEPYGALDSAAPLQLGLPLYINYFHDDADTKRALEQTGKRYIRSVYMYIRDTGIVIDLFVEESLWNRYLTEVAGEQILPGESPVYDYTQE